MRKVLTVAGFDPSGGAGITKDLEIFSFFGLHGLSIPTVLTVQGPEGVRDIAPVEPHLFEEMLFTLQNLKIEGLKIGVLWRKAYGETLISFIKRNRPFAVLDPVLESKNGFPFIDEEGIEFIREYLLKEVNLITPNIKEAERILGVKISDLDGRKEAAKRFLELGTKAVVIKGGHGEGDPVDLCFDGKEFLFYERERIEEEIHGTGCLFSSLLLSFLILGYPLKEGFYETEKYLDEAFRERYRLDERGLFYTSLSFLSREAERQRVISEMKRIKERIEGMDLGILVPEVQMNIGYALRDAKGIEDVAAFPGRIGVYKGKIFVKGEPEFGSSSHVARSLIEFMRYFPYIRSCANVRYEERFIKKAEEKGLKVLFFDRKKEPESIKKEEGKSLSFNIGKVLKEAPFPPDLIYDLGDIGKEPMIRIFGRDPFEVLKKMEMVIS